MKMKKKILEALFNWAGTYGTFLVLYFVFMVVVFSFGWILSGCSSPTNPIVYDEESLEDDMEYIDSGKTLSEKLKRFREVQEEDLLKEEGDLK